ncbi:MAG: AsmA family protein [Acidobacteria bacterium]|nr:MAG: AsmA family protein [Acidobacteriota bacterium]
MTNLARKSLLILAAIIVLVLVGVSIFLLTLDPNRYRGYIVDRLSQTLGRPVEAADVDLEWVPLSLTLNEIRVAESADFEGEYILSAQAISIQVTLLSLLTGDPVVSEFQVERPTIYLREDSSGQWNITRLGQTTGSGNETEQEETSGGAPIETPVRNWVLNEGTVVVERSGHQPIRLEGINLTFSDISTQHRFPFQIRATFQGDTRLAAKGLIGPLNLDSFAETPFSAEGQLEANLESLRATLQDWVPQITPLSGRMTFDWNLSRTNETPLRVSGKVHLEDASLQPQGFTRPFTIQEADLEFDPNQAELKNLKIAIGEGTIEGYAKVNDFEAPRVEFELGGDYLDVSALESLIDFAQKPSRREQQGEGQADQGGNWFTRMTGNGQLKFNRVQHGTLILEPFEATVRIANSQLLCEPISFGLHGGTGGGRLQIDLSHSEPSVSFSVQLEQVNANQLLSANTGSKDRLFGNLQVSLQLETTGAERNRIFETARGQGTLRLTEGLLGLLNLGREVATINSLVGLPFTEKDTILEELSSTFQIADGWVRTKDLIIRTPELTLSAVGGISLDGELDFEATAAFTPEASQKLSGPAAGLFGRIFTDSYKRIVIPFDIKSSFLQPQFKLDGGRLVMMRLGVFLTKPPAPPQEETPPE